MSQQSVSDWANQMRKFFDKIVYMPEHNVQQIRDYVATFSKEDIEFVANARVRYVSPIATKILSGQNHK